MQRKRKRVARFMAKSGKLVTFARRPRGSKKCGVPKRLAQLEAARRRRQGGSYRVVYKGGGTCGGYIVVPKRK